MSETTNHVAEANSSLDMAASTNSWDTCEPWIMQAQVHATLALAEQQRIANLIALGQYRIGPDEFPVFRNLVVQPKNDYEVDPTEVLREGLGL